MEEGLHVRALPSPPSHVIDPGATSDYRGLKKRITAIRLAQDPQTDGTTPLVQPASPTLDPSEVHTQSHLDNGKEQPTLSPVDSATEVDAAQDGFDEDDDAPDGESAMPQDTVRHLSSYSQWLR